MPTEQIRRVYAGNRMAISIADTPNNTVGLIQNANVSMSLGLDGQSGIGNVEMQEYIPTVARITVNSDQTYVFHAEIDRIAHVVPMQPVLSLDGWVFDIHADKLADDNAGDAGSGWATIWAAKQCSLDNGSFSTAKHGAVGRSCTWQALSYNVGSLANGG